MSGMRLCTVAVMAGLATGLLAQQETPRFRVAVDMVRVDAVVTDKDGTVVRDLTANEFEILQDGKKQKVTFAEFVPVSVASSRTPDTPLKAKPVVGAPPTPSGPVRRENVQRTIALVVDDLAMSVESLYYVKRGLHDYIDHSMKPGDLVALVRTGGSSEGLQPFTTDRRVLHAAIDNLKWNGFSSSGVEAFQAVNQHMVVDSHATFSPDDFSALDAARGSAMAAGTLGALNLVIQGARTLPGRKALLFVSEGFRVLEGSQRNQMASPDPHIRDALDRAIDQAARAGVVIYSIDARGLQSGRLLASDNLKVPGLNSTMEETVRGKEADRSDLRRDTQEGMAYLAEQTGGLAILNTNDIGAGLARASNDVRDYYVLGYTPESTTFAGKGEQRRYHQIKIRVRRAGLTIRTRKEFLGVSDVEKPAAPETPVQQLVNAAISPFAQTDIALRTTTLPGYDAERGLFVRALLHIDAHALTFAPQADGTSTASADVLGMVFDRNGTEVAHLSTGFSAALSQGATQTGRGEGLAYTLRIPIPRAGPYQLRFALRDRASGNVGTAGEFLDLPDVAHGVFAISGIVLRSAGDLGPADANRVVISPSQAVRTYAAGAEVKYACEIYNASAPVQLGLSVWRGTERVLASEPRTLTPPPGVPAAFAIGGAFKLGASLPPGRYVLQLAAETAGRDARVSRALQQMDFDVK